MAFAKESFQEGGLRPMQYTLTRAHVHHHARQLLQHHLRLHDYGVTCPAPTLLAIVFAACARLVSLCAAARTLRDAPSAETVRKALHDNLPEADELERRLNHALVADLPRALRRQRQRLAADLTLVPYHGEPLASALEIYRSQAKSGTTHSHAYATLYLVSKGQRFTLALTWVRRGETLDDVLARLLRRASALGIRPCVLLLDRGFYSVDVIRYLQAARYPFLMPVVCRGRPDTHPLGAGGSRIFQYFKRSGWGRYTLTNSAGRRATVSICVKCRNRAGARGRIGREALVYAYWGIEPPSFDWVRQTYRRRFGIETSYRQLREAKARTCTRSPVVRLFLVGVALVLRNVWVWLHWEQLSTPRRGGRRLRLERLCFKDLLLWLLEVAQALFGTRDGIRSDRPIGPEVMTT
jgi:putative transposase